MISTTIRLLISFALLGLLVYILRNDIPAILTTLQSVQSLPLILGISLLMVGALLMGLRLKVVFAAQKMRVAWTECVMATFVGLFFNNFLPTSVGGDVAKTFCISKKTGNTLGSISAVFMDRVFALLMFVLIPSVTVIFLRDQLDPVVPMIVFCVLAGASAFMLTIIFPQILSAFMFLKCWWQKVPGQDKIVDIYKSMNALVKDRQKVTIICFIALLGQLLNIVAIYYIAKSISGSLDIGFGYFLLSIPVIHLFSMLPSINGLGIRESGFLYFFKDSLGGEGASALAILFLSSLILMSFVGGVIYALRKDYHFKMNNLKVGSGR